MLARVRVLVSTLARVRKNIQVVNWDVLLFPTIKSFHAAEAADSAQGFTRLSVVDVRLYGCGGVLQNVGSSSPVVLPFSLQVK